jgi:hypothetical protein
VSAPLSREAHGLVDGQPTGAHFGLLVYDDVGTLESVSTPEQVEKSTNAWALSDNLGARNREERLTRGPVATLSKTETDQIAQALAEVCGASTAEFYRLSRYRDLGRS